MSISRIQKENKMKIKINPDKKAYIELIEEVEI